MCRYELPQPGSAQKNDIVAWQESVDNSMAQLEHQAARYVHTYNTMRDEVQCSTHALTVRCAEACSSIGRHTGLSQ